METISDFSLSGPHGPLFILQGVIPWLLLSIVTFSRISSADDSCRRVYSSNEATLTSPIYPSNYGLNKSCLYEITVPEGGRVLLTFTRFKLEKASPCNSDYVKVYDGGDESSSSLGTFCGYDIPDSLLSSGNKITVYFYTSGSNVDGVFSARFRSVTCASTVRSTSGTISSPNYPNRYNPHDRCIYRIIVPDNNIIMLNFENFELEMQSACQYDYVKIYDGDVNKPSLGTFCGTSVPGPIYSTGNEVTMEFRSDDSNQYKGFSVKFKQGPCNRNIVAREGTIASPNFPSNYDGSTKCFYKITVPEGNAVRLTFQEFELEPHATCNYDNVKIRDGHELSSHVIGPFCGSTIPDPVLTSGNKITIEFRTDSGTHKKGFLAKFEAVSATEKVCPTNSTKWKDLGEDFCYLAEKLEEVNWNDALYECYEAGGSLASFHSQEEIDRVLTDVSGIGGKEFYIGLRQNGDGSFQWDDKSPLDFLNWKSAGPNQKSEMCVILIHDTGKWRNVDCSRSYRYICTAQKAVRSSFQSGIQKICPTAHRHWRDFGGNFCYILMESVEYSWNSASDLCNAAGGRLASFHSAEEVSLVLQHITNRKKNLHIGFKRTPDGEFVWEDNTVVDFLNWNYDEPNYADEKCSEIYSGTGKWNDIQCTKELGYICATPKVYPHTTHDGLKMACIKTSDGWIDYGGNNCYFFATDEKKWEPANQKCQSIGGHLASFHSVIEIMSLGSSLTTSTTYIGLRRSDTVPDDFVWADGTKVDFLYWNDGEPNTLAEKCVEMYKTDDTWNDIVCSADRRYICSRPKSPSCSGSICNHGVCLEGYDTPAKCVCAPYYKGLLCDEKITCYDNPCKNGATCRTIQSTASYECNCDHGYTGYDCDERISCSANLCKNSGTCTQNGPNNIFMCTCKHGYRGQTCAEKISCTSNTCSNSGTCTQDGPDGVFRCTCKHGYTDLTCTEKILCSENPCINSGSCDQDGENGIFRCTCEHGYKGLTCAEKILCSESPCKNLGTCTQNGENGTFRCTCEHGYKDLICEEKILCSDKPCLNSGICSQDGANGIFKCICEHGYKGLTCEEKILCQNDTCQNSGLCTQDGENGVFRCTCDHGYEGLVCEEKILCENDTCAYGGLCSQDGENGIFRCTCSHGYSGRLCEQTILCANDMCNNDGICTQDGINGVFRCTCQHGYRGLVCEEKILCETGTCANGGLCSQDGANGVFRCTCSHGYSGPLCEEKILCANDTCKNDGICTQDGINGVFKCTCQHGYLGLMCEERIVCGYDTCENGGLCTQDGINGVFRCTCQHGYRGLTCLEKILCGKETCENGGLCTQDGAYGVFRCTCPHGYRGLRCEERIVCGYDTCENLGVCSQDGVNGIFRCTCPHGYRGLTCEERIVCGYDTCENSGLCTQDGINGVFRCTCQHGYRGLTCLEQIVCAHDTCENGGLCTQDGANGIFRCTCMHGYQGMTCQEKIECTSYTCENDGICSQDGINGVFRCTCQHGYQGLTCEEKILCGIDTCENGGLCSQDGALGTFKCTCNHGYRGLKCKERILCANDTCSNEGLCTQDSVSDIFRCTCKHGYRGLTCEEKIFCEADTCKHEGTCTQDGEEGVFKCKCKHGYNGLTCEERILCGSGICSNGGTCTQDGEGGIFRCQCKAGYSGLTCETSVSSFEIQQISDKEYIIRGNMVVDVSAKVDFE